MRPRTIARRKASTWKALQRRECPQPLVGMTIWRISFFIAQTYDHVWDLNFRSFQIACLICCWAFLFFSWAPITYEVPLGEVTWLALGRLIDLITYLVKRFLSSWQLQIMLYFFLVFLAFIARAIYHQGSGIMFRNWLNRQCDKSQRLV